jgi:glycosyltransferase involved in cell wall biosynthesis
MALAAMGHDIHTIARRRDNAPANEWFEGVHIHRVAAPGPPVLYSPLFFRESHRKFRELHRAAPFDVAQGNMPLMSSWGVRGGNLPPFVETVHCTVQEELKAVSHKSFPRLNLNEMLSQLLSPVWQSRERYLLGRARRVISVSAGLMRELMSQYGYPSGRATVIPNGVDYMRFGGDSTVAEKAHEVRRSLCIQPEERVILYLGRLMERKRVIDLVAAMPRILTGSPNTRLVIVGKRNSNAERLEAEARNLQVAERVQLVNHVPYSEVPAYYAMADVYCLPSAYEGFPFTVLEAMSAGTPVVASDIPGIDEQVTPNRTGLLHAVGDINQISQHILRVLADTCLARRLSTAGRNLVRQKYDWSLIGAQTEEVFRQAAMLPVGAEGRAAW